MPHKQVRPKCENYFHRRVKNQKQEKFTELGKFSDCQLEPSHHRSTCGRFFRYDLLPCDSFHDLAFLLFYLVCVCMRSARVLSAPTSETMHHETFSGFKPIYFWSIAQTNELQDIFAVFDANVSLRGIHLE